VIGSKPHEAHEREPNRDDFRNQFSSGDGEEDGHCDEPICQDSAKEDLVPTRRHDFCPRKIDSFGSVITSGERTAVASQNSHKKEHACEVCEE
jgi:hypothetical protein